MGAVKFVDLNLKDEVEWRNRRCAGAQPQVMSGELSLSKAPSTFSFRFFYAIKSVSPLPLCVVDLSNHTCSRPLVQPLTFTFARRRGKAAPILSR